MARILIVEDEILIADSIARHLKAQGYEVVGVAISFAEAWELIQGKEPDLALIDIRLRGPQTGIDLAQAIRKSSRPIPYLFLTSQSDPLTLEKAKRAHPAGYLSKPLQPASLRPAIEVALYNHQAQQPHPITLSVGTEQHRVDPEAIEYLEADHVYVQVWLQAEERPLLVRETLSDLLDRLPKEKFLRCHRSYAVRLGAIQGWNKQRIHLEHRSLPIGGSYKAAVLRVLEE